MINYFIFFTPLVESQFEKQMRSSLGISNETKVNDNTGSSTQGKPALAVYDNKIYCVWNDQRKGDFDIYFSSADAAASPISWGDGIKDTDIKINDDFSATDQKNPDIAINSNGIIFVVWEDYRFNNSDIFISYSNDFGAKWSENIPVNGSVPWTDNQEHPKIAIDSKNNIYITMVNDKSGDSNIKIIHSTDNGISYSDAVTITSNLIMNGSSDVDLSSGKDDSLHICWAESIDNFNSNIYYTTLSDSWPNFRDPIRVDNETVDIIKMRPSIFVDESGDIFITWLENENNRYNVYFDKLYEDDFGFHNDVLVNNKHNSVHSDTVPDVEVTAEGIIYISWVLKQAENHIVISPSVDGGRTFLNDTTVDSSNSIEAQQERINAELIDSNPNLFIVWEDYRNDPLPSNDFPENGDVYFASIAGLSNQAPPKIKATVTVDSWSSITLIWEICQVPDFKYYKLEIASSFNFEPEKIIDTVFIYDRLLLNYAFKGLNPVTDYFLRISVFDNGELYSVSKPISTQTKENVAPELEILQPDGISDVANETYIIRWEDNDPDNNATISLYFYHELLGEQLIITVSEGEDGENDLYYWNTTDLIEGAYTIKIKINDSHNLPVIRISEYDVIVNHSIKVILPEIISIYPSELLKEVSIDTSISIYFNKPINISSLENIMSVYTLGFEPVEGSLNYDELNFSINFSPTNLLQLDTWYTVTINTNIIDLNGLSNKISLSWKFKTIPIEIRFLNPYDSAKDVNLEDEITISFSEEMNITSLEQTIQIKPEIKLLKFKWEDNNSKVMISHSEFAPDTLYKLSIGPRIKSKSGTTILNRLSISFLTEYKNLAPRLLDAGFLKLDGTYLFYVEYEDRNNDEPKKAEIFIYRDNEFYLNSTMKAMTRDIADKIKNFYEPNSKLLDGKYNNSELFYYELELSEGKYSFFFEFEDYYGLLAESDLVPLDLENAGEGPEVEKDSKDITNYLVIMNYIAIVSLIILIIVILLIVYRQKKTGEHIKVIKQQNIKQKESEKDEIDEE